MKAFRIFMATILVLLPLLSLGACGFGGDEPEVEPAKQPVIDLAGGTLTIMNIESATFEDIVKSIPRREGYDFVAWFSDAAYTDRIDPQSITDAQKKEARAYAMWLEKVEEKTYNVRDSEVQITASGREDQHMDKISISKDFPIEKMRLAGYTALEIKVTMDVVERDDTAQYVYVYKDETCKTDSISIGSLLDYIEGTTSEDPSLLHTHRFEHGSGHLDTNWGTTEFTATIPLESLVKDLYLRYGAYDGDGNDAWVTKNVVVTVTPIK